MKVDALIDAIMRQTAELIADLATLAGTRAPLAEISDHFFVDLNRALRSRGVGTKVAADMFGLAVRGYQTRARRLTAQRSDRARSVWQAVMGYVRREGPLTRAAIMTRFSRDDEAIVRGVLHDIVETGLVERDGRGPGALYRGAPIATPLAAASPEADEALVWLTLCRLAPRGVRVERPAIAEATRLPEPRLAAALARLHRAGRVERLADSPERWRAEVCVIEAGDSAGMGAAVLDHYQAVIEMIGRRLTHGRAVDGWPVGGGTYRFDLWPGHPLGPEVARTLDAMRDQLDALRAQVDAHNASSPDHRVRHRVAIYIGQGARRVDPPRAPGQPSDDDP